MVSDVIEETQVKTKFILPIALDLYTREHVRRNPLGLLLCHNHIGSVVSLSIHADDIVCIYVLLGKLLSHFTVIVFVSHI